VYWLASFPAWIVKVQLSWLRSIFKELMKKGGSLIPFEAMEFWACSFHPYGPSP
jgi:hypothetical protein